tara:strand:- start:112 stop:1515 length:1404 start_codon:yes stop_codon:yes gene_type:complete
MADLRTLAEQLTNRFFFVREVGNQRFFYDAETGDDNLTYMHLIPHLQALLSEGNNVNFVGKKAEGFQALTFANWRPILLKPIYGCGANSKVVSSNGNLYPNIWRKPLIEPTEFQTLFKARKGARQFVEHLQTMLGDTTTDLDDENSKAGYLIRMLAYRYQVHDFRQTQKPHVAFYFYGKQGYGKGIFSDTLQAVFGESAVMKVPDEKSLNSMSSVDIFSRTWAVVDEVNIAKGDTNYNKIKTHTGTTQTSSARKNEHFKQYYIPAQLMMFSQKPPTFIETGDRRFFISQWDCEFDSSQQKDNYFGRYTHWLQNEGGYSAIAGLLEKTDIKTLRAESPAMMTPEKRQVVAMVTDDAVTDIQLAVEDKPDVICFTESDFDNVWFEHDITKKARGYKLQEAGLVETAKKKYEGKRTIKFFVRPEYELIVKNGMPNTLTHKGQKSKDILLKDELGYQGAMGSAKRSARDEF